MGKKSIYPYVRVQVVALHDAALNQLRIPKQLKTSRCCSQNVIKKYKQLDRFDDLKHTGHSKKLSGRDICYLKRLVQGSSRLSASKIATNLNDSLPEPVTTRTIRGYLKDLAFEYVVKIQKQRLSAHHRQHRIAWYKQYLNWTKDHWRKVIFAGKSTFYVLKRQN